MSLGPFSILSLSLPKQHQRKGQGDRKECRPRPSRAKQGRCQEESCGLHGARSEFCQGQSRMEDDELR
eukprot:scaffold10679_cov99-Skeletonema_dohrnii-CCMP3373.AAC.10